MTGRKAELVARVEAYRQLCKNAVEPDPVEPMPVPEKTLFKDIQENSVIPPVTKEMVKSYLESHEAVVTDKAKLLYENYFMNYIQNCGRYIKSSVRAAMKKTSYEVNLQVLVNHFQCSVNSSFKMVLTVFYFSIF